MNIYGEYVRRAIDENGDIELTFKIHNYRDKEISKELEKEVIYKIGLTVAKSKRTLEQNALMWELIHEINNARGTNRANDDFDIYLEALQRAGVKTEYIAALPETSDKYGLIVPLCPMHHDMIHTVQTEDIRLKKAAQRKFEMIYSHEKWMKEFHKNYL